LISAIAVLAIAAEPEIYEISENHKVAYHHVPAKQGQETVVLLNGYFYALENWAPFIEALTKNGVGTLLLAYSTQPESLRAMSNDKPHFVGKTPSSAALEIDTLVDEATQVIDFLGIETFTLATLSYGAFPGLLMAQKMLNRINRLILMAPPAVLSLRHDFIGAQMHQGFEFQKNFNPWVSADFAYDQTIRYGIDKMYGAITRNSSYEELGINPSDHLTGLFQMARAVKWTNLVNVIRELPQDLPLALFVAEKETPGAKRDQSQLWGAMKDHPADSEKVVFKGAHHALPGSVPKKLAQRLMRKRRGKVAARTSCRASAANSSTDAKSKL